MRTVTIKQQSGYTLLVGIILITVLSTIGIAAMKDTLLEEKMAHNFQDKQQSFQTAENALKVAELTIIPGLNLSTIAELKGYADRVTPDSDEIDWANSLVVNQAPHHDHPPVIIIEKIATVVGSPRIGVGKPQAEEIDLIYYRITAKASGLTNQSETQLESVLAR